MELYKSFTYLLRRLKISRGDTSAFTVKYRLLTALVDKPQAQIMCQKPGKTLIPIDKPQVYFVDVVKCVNEVCSQR